jgi:WD40 repeat protein
VHVLPDGRTALTAGVDGAICRWDLSTGRELSRVRVEGPFGFRPLAFTPDGRGLQANNILVTTADGRTRTHVEVGFVDTATGRRQRLAEAFAPTGRHFLTPPLNGTVLLAESGAESKVTLRDWPSGELRLTLPLPKLPVPAVGHRPVAGAATPDGRRVAVLSTDGSSGHVSVFDAGRLVQHVPVPGAVFFSAAFTADGAGLVVAGGVRQQPEQLQLIDVASGKSIRTFVPPEVDPAVPHQVVCLAIAPNGRLLAAPDPNGAIWLYDLATGQARRKLAGHPRTVSSLAFTPDSRTLVSVSHDQTGLVWDVSRDAP